MMLLIRVLVFFIDFKEFFDAIWISKHIRVLEIEAPRWFSPLLEGVEVYILSRVSVVLASREGLRYIRSATMFVELTKDTSRSVLDNGIPPINIMSILSVLTDHLPGAKPVEMEYRLYLFSFCRSTSLRGMQLACKRSAIFSNFHAPVLQAGCIMCWQFRTVLGFYHIDFGFQYSDQKHFTAPDS